MFHRLFLDRQQGTWARQQHTSGVCTLVSVHARCVVHLDVATSPDVQSTCMILVRSGDGQAAGRLFQPHGVCSAYVDAVAQVDPWHEWSAARAVWGFCTVSDPHWSRCR